MEDIAPHLHINTENQELIIAAAVMHVVGRDVYVQHLLQIAFHLDINGFIQLNLVTFKPSQAKVFLGVNGFLAFAIGVERTLNEGLSTE